VNPGWIQAVDEVFSQGKRYLLLGGNYNAWNGAMFAVLGENQPPAASPVEPRTAYSCEGCPPGKPVRFFFFPRSELNRALATETNYTHMIRVLPDRIQVFVRESSPESGLLAIYEFDREFNLLAARRTDAYWSQHRRLEQEGKLRHTVEECMEWKQRVPIKVWTAEQGWSDQLPRAGQPGHAPPKPR